MPHARNPSIFYCYPPPPKIASAAPPKPFLELSLVLKNNHDIQSVIGFNVTTHLSLSSSCFSLPFSSLSPIFTYIVLTPSLSFLFSQSFLQTLIQEMGLIIDLDWLVELIPLFQFLAAPKNDVSIIKLL